MEQVEQQSGSIRKTYQYTLKPTLEPARIRERTLMLCRPIHTAALGERRAAYRMRNSSVSYYPQQAALAGIKEAMPEYREGPSQVLQEVVLRGARAFPAFCRRMQAGETPGYPRFQGRERLNSLPYPQYDHGATLDRDNGVLVLSTIGRVAVRWSRPGGPWEGTPKTVTLSGAAAGWYVGISGAEVPGPPLELTGQETSIARGLESFATLANGTMLPNPRGYRKADRRLKTAQRRVSRRKKGSTPLRRTAVRLLAKAHQHGRRQRRDFQQQAALKLVRAYDARSHAELPVAHRLKNHHLAKSIADAGWSGFLSILAFKAAYAGKRVIAVNPAVTTPLCSGGGVVVKKGLSVRWQFCPDCGTRLQRDHNAALNMLRLGKAHSTDGQSVQALTWPNGASVA